VAAGGAGAGASCAALRCAATASCSTARASACACACARVSRRPSRTLLFDDIQGRVSVVVKAQRAVLFALAAIVALHVDEKRFVLRAGPAAATVSAAHDSAETRPCARADARAPAPALTSLPMTASACTLNADMVQPFWRDVLSFCRWRGAEARKRTGDDAARRGVRWRATGD
jgi:hypothetical protein